MNSDQKTSSSTLKPLPFGAKKSLVFKMYPSTPENTLRSTMHYCQKLLNHKNLPEAELINKQWLSKNVLEEIIKYEGAPAGYEKNFRE